MPCLHAYSNIQGKIQNNYFVLDIIYMYCVCMHACMVSHFSCKSLQSLSPGKNTGMACHFILQGLDPNQALNQQLMSPVWAGGFFTTSAT